MIQPFNPYVELCKMCVKFWDKEVDEENADHIIRMIHTHPYALNWKKSVY